MFFNYSGVMITSKGILVRLLVHQANNAGNVYASVNDTIWHIHLKERVESKNL